MKLRSLEGESLFFKIFYKYGKWFGLEKKTIEILGRLQILGEKMMVLRKYKILKPPYNRIAE
ncbi:hypothetical protein BWI96_18395 [Siphonobacter sp. SORGH_AS_0500]|nr:hypothetical protein BWI96_18395 [Siphonobacter sp. SORGH_AS_0500]